MIIIIIIDNDNDDDNDVFVSVWNEDCYFKKNR